MIIAYHAIFTTYGTWLPNDPRGSFSKNVYNAELKALGEVKYGRQSPQPDRKIVRRFHAAANARLSRKPYYINNQTRPAIAGGFGDVVDRLRLTVHACAIMNNHVHLLVIRTRHQIEYLVNQFKGAATIVLKRKQTPWTRGGWNVFINDEESLVAAAKYIEANPPAAGLAPQRWDFVTPLRDC